ncbi:hypothetical protein QTP70_025043, partial [Hemibagrus guttatus]
MDSLLEALQSGAAFRDRRKRAPRPRDEATQMVSQRPVLKDCNHGKWKSKPKIFLLSVCLAHFPTLHFSLILQSNLSPPSLTLR